MNKLKKDAESIDEAIDDAKKVENAKRSQIDKLKTQLIDENQKQKDLETF